MTGRYDGPIADVNIRPILGIRFLPALIFAGALVTVAFLWQHVVSTPAWGNPSLAKRNPPSLDLSSDQHFDNHPTAAVGRELALRAAAGVNASNSRR